MPLTKFEMSKSIFIKIFKRLPEEARKGLIWDSYGDNPMTINVIYFEIINNTKMGERLLKEMGFKIKEDK